MADADGAPDPTEVDLAPPPVPKSANRKVALVLGALAVAAAGVFAALALGGSGNGPEDPVRAMMDAVQRGDALGMMEQLDPGERDALRQPLTDLVGELNRLDVLHDADLGHVTGIDVQVDDLELRHTTVRDDLARVAISGGKGSYRFDASKLPLGGFVRDLAGDALDATSSGSDTLRSTSADDFVATVRRGDRWYVSIGYTVAENARQSAGVSIDSLRDGVAAKGADSPEAAVRELVEAGTNLDVRRVIELLPPDELAAVHDYARMFRDDAERSAAEARDGLRVTVPTLELDSETDGDHGRVFVRDVAVEGTADGRAFSLGDGCFDVAGEEPVHFCTDDDPAALFGPTFGTGSRVEPPTLSFAGKHAKIGIAVTRVDGKWYVSPTRTLLEGLVGELRLFQPRDLESIRDYIQQMIDEATSFDRYSTYGEGGVTTTPTTAN